MSLAVDSVLIRRLGIFLHVSETLNYSDSARQLGVTQSALTQAIQALESRLGLKLFVRSGNGVALTSRAGELLIQARLMVKQYNDGLARLDYLASEANQSLTIGVTSPSQFYPLLSAFNARYPHTTVTIKTGNSASLLQAAMALEVDLAQWGGDQAPQGVQSTFLGKQQLMAILPTNHPMAGRASMTLSELCQQTLLIREEGSDTRKLLIATIEKNNINPARSLEIPSREGVFEATAAGLGVTVSLDRELLHTPGTVAVQIDRGAIMSGDYLICNPEAENLMAVKTFMATATTGVNETAKP